MHAASKPYQRWRVACSAIHFIGRLASLSKKVLQTTTSLALPRSISYTAIDVQPDVSVPPLNIDQQTLSTITRDKNIQLLHELGGVQDLALVLQTSVNNGITGGEADLLHRTNAFGSNKYVKPPPKGLMSFVWEAANDMTLMILTACAVLSLGFGIKTHGLKEGWYDGGSILIAVLLVIALSVFSNSKQSRQFAKLSSASSDICIQVVRDGRRQPISIFEVVVGDVVCLKIGDQIPADGLFLEGHSLKLDESSMTGESEHVEVNVGTNPFLTSGTKVIDGYGFMLVTSVGMNTAWGEMMSTISNTLDEQTPLQARLNKLTSFIGKGGVVVAVLVLAVLMTRYFTGNTRDDMGNREFRGSRTKATDVTDAVIRIISAAVTIIVVAIPEGLPLAVTLTLAFSMKRMMSDNAMVRKLSACETMGSATTICTDKTGTLTLNEMKVTEFWLGNEVIANNISSHIAPNVLQLLKEGVGLNTTGTVYTPNSTSPPEISGSSTEKAILSWGVFELGLKIDQVKQNCEIINVEAFNSEKKQSGVLMRRNGEKAVHVHRKGAAEMVLAMCSNYYDKGGSAESIDEAKRREFESIIKDMAAKSLRCIAFAHRRITEENEQVQEKKLEDSELTLLGVVGLKDPCRPGVRETVESCKNAGVNVKMITGDNVHTARAIAIECGILSLDNEFNGDEVVEGIQFRNYSLEERMAKVDSICVMARSSPLDKLLMVQCLKQKGHVVAVTGDGTNDAPALREADIGLSMGIQGTEVAKESSDIVILDDNFTSVVKVLWWGRCVYNNIQKFLQFQLTVNVAALVINLVAAVSTGEVPLSAVQLLWVNMIMDTLGALALATEQPSNDLMKKSPVGRSEPLITRVMWRNIIAQALYQVAVLLILQFKGMSIFGVEEKVKNTLIFNSFVLCQIFNEFNARKLEKKNIFEGILKSRLFLGIVVMTIILQAILVEFLKKFANTERLSWGQWGACIGIAALSWPIGWLVKCIPVSNKQQSNLSRASST